VSDRKQENNFLSPDLKSLIPQLCGWDISVPQVNSPGIMNDISYKINLNL
jgi:hypothetical protein